MSSLIVEVCEVAEVMPHPHADRMSVARIKGWHVCVAKDAVTGEPWCKVGDKVVFFPPDAVLQPDVAEKHGVTKYLGELSKNEDGTRPPGGRVKVANLRGFKSYGFVALPDDPAWEIGKDVAEHYRVTKYEPPIKANQGDAERPHHAFHVYHDMENIRNFPNAFQEGEEVAVTEKIHGENIRLGLIRDTNDQGEIYWRWMAGSHNVNRKRFQKVRDKETGELSDSTTESVSWRCFSPAIRAYLCFVSVCGYTPEEVDKEPLIKDDTGYNVVLFGERYGSGVQDLWYGHTNGQFSFRAFDVAVDGKYLDYDTKLEGFYLFGVDTVPEVWRGPYSFARIEELAEGQTLVTTGKSSFREGVVVIAVKERTVPLEGKFMDRAQLKCISFAYLARKEGTEFH